MRKILTIILVLIFPVASFAGPSVSGGASKSGGYDAGGAGTGNVDPKRILPFGDSLTLGQNDSPIVFGYRDHLQDLLGIGVFDFVGDQTSPSTDPVYDVSHSGIGGNTTTQMQSRLAALLTNYMGAPNDSTSAIIMMGGTNDINGCDPTCSSTDYNGTATRISAMIDAIDTHDANIRVYVGLIPPRADSASKDTESAALNATLKTMLDTKKASKVNLHYYDLNAATKANASWETDYGWSGSHPNDAGYQVWATTIYNCMNNSSSTYCDGN